MAYIQGISQGYTTAEAAARQKKDDTGDKLGLDDFLTLLVAQLQNQDPLNPTDSTEFTAQLTQYSQLEQSINMNNNMEELLDIQRSSDRLSALSLIDKQVLVQGSSFELGEGATEIGYKVDGEVTDLAITIRDQGGRTVATLYPAELDPGNHFVTWDGLDSNGEHLPAGTYEITIDALGSGPDGASPVVPLVYTEVTGVDMSGSEALLLSRGGEYNLSAIQGVYQQDSSQQAEAEEDGESAGAATTPETASAATDDAGTTGDTATSDGSQGIAATVGTDG